LIYAVSVLLNVFRYVMKLSAFCQARANALSLALELDEKEIESFKELAQILAAERIDFGKEPATPVENVIELLKASKDAANNVTKKGPEND
jgi:hypothetical protein